MLSQTCMLCIPQFPHITLSLIHNGQCVAEKSHWGKPFMCTKKICLSYIFTFALAKRQNCKMLLRICIIQDYLCRSKRKLYIRSGTIKALLFLVSMTWSQPKSNQLPFIIESAVTTFRCCNTRRTVAVNSPFDKSLQCERNMF